MSIADLAGREVQLIGAAHPLDPMYSAVIRATDTQSNALLLEFNTPSFIAGKEYPFAVARPRGDSGRISTLTQRGRLSCDITWVPSEHYSAAQSFDVSWWRGGAAATADVVLI